MKRTISMLLAMLILLGVLAACTTSDPETSDEPAPTPTADQSDNEGTEAPTEPGVVKLPLVDEETHLSIWWWASASFLDITDMSENLTFETMTERTNVQLDFITPTADGAETQFNLIIASNDLPDIFSNIKDFYKGGFDKAIDDEYIIALNDYTEYVPNMMRLREEMNVQKETTTDAGRIAGLIAYKVDYERNNEGAWLGQVIRQDWLDAQDLAVPETYDEMADVLRELKAAYPSLGNGPMFLPTNGTGIGYGLLSGYNITSTFYQVNDTIKYAPLEPEFKEYLQLLNAWYEEGLIDQGFYTETAYWGDIAKVANNEYAVFDSIYTWSPTYKASAIDPDFALAPVPPLVHNKGDKVEVRMSTPKAYFQGAISTQCEDIELALRYWDYFYSDDGILLSNFGVEGETFEYVDGQPMWTEAITNNPLGYDLSTAQYRYLLFNCPGYIIYNREHMALDESAIRSVAVWNTSDDTRMINGTVSMTGDEGTIYSNAMSDIETFLTESVAKYIIGDASFDNYENDFVNQIKNMGIDDAIAVQQAAYDRFIAR